jgi:hypothetical protein
MTKRIQAEQFMERNSKTKLSKGAWGQWQQQQDEKGARLFLFARMTRKYTRFILIVSVHAVARLLDLDPEEVSLLPADLLARVEGPQDERHSSSDEDMPETPDEGCIESPLSLQLLASPGSFVPGALAASASIPRCARNLAAAELMSASAPLAALHCTAAESVASASAAALSPSPAESKRKAERVLERFPKFQRVLDTATGKILLVPLITDSDLEEDLPGATQARVTGRVGAPLNNEAVTDPDLMLRTTRREVAGAMPYFAESVAPTQENLVYCTDPFIAGDCLASGAFVRRASLFRAFDVRFRACISGSITLHDARVLQVPNDKPLPVPSLWPPCDKYDQGQPLLWSGMICAFEPGVFEPLYAGLVACGALHAVIAALSAAPAAILAGRLRTALVARADPSVKNRHKPPSDLVTTAFQTGLTPDTRTEYHPDGWMALAPCRGFGGEGLRDLLCWRYRQYGTCTSPWCPRNHGPYVDLRFATLALFVKSRPGVGFAERAPAVPVQLDQLLQTAIANKLLPDPKPQCFLAWSHGADIVECGGYIFAPEGGAAFATMLHSPTMMWALVSFGKDLCPTLLTDKGRVKVKINEDSTDITYRVVAATYRQPGHYISYVRFGERWFCDTGSALRLEQFDESAIPVHSHKHGAELKNLLLVKE